MIEYIILCKNVKIGILQINDRNEYKYIPDENGINIIKDEISLFSFMLNETNFDKPIPYFQNKINDAKKFSTEDDIISHTDPFRMILIKGGKQNG